MTDLQLPREENVRIASELWPVFAETNRAAAIDLVRKALRGEPCRATPAEAARIRELAALAVSRAPACRRIVTVNGRNAP